MAEIVQLISVENTINRAKRPTQQKLRFVIQLASLSYDKELEILWCGKDGYWHSLAASYLSASGEGLEYWQAKLVLRLKSKRTTLPGSITFAVRCRCQGQEYWDNNNGENYYCRVGTALSLHPNRILQNLNFADYLRQDQQWLTVKIAVNSRYAINRLAIHWTKDNWQHIHYSVCRCQKASQALETQIWTARLKSGAAFKIEYVVYAQSAAADYWDNNNGANYTASHKQLKVMILNLHCYQETEQDAKFSAIARAINELDVDVVCFQEVAEYWNHGHGDWPSNSANIINQRLKQDYYLYSDWSHIGFDRYREGVAILSRFPFLFQQSRYVSDNHDIYSIHSRKVVMARVAIPYMGNINIFSAHLSWWEDGFQQQFNHLCSWSEHLLDQDTHTSLLCGDFNINAGSPGYWLVVDSHKYQDQYLAANAQGLFEQIYQVNDPHWRHYTLNDYRIDYIFKNKESPLQVTSARVLFTEYDYGQVSDHCGYLMSFAPNNE